MNKSLTNRLVAAAVTALLAAPAASADTWKPIANGMLRDDLMTVLYSFDKFYEFEVQIEESQERPGRYRLVNAYRNFPVVWVEFPYDTYTNYLIVDATDPKHVYVEKGLTGNYSGHDQTMHIWSQAADMYFNIYGDWAKVDEEGVCGSCVDGIITFPRNALLLASYDIPADTTQRWDGADPDQGPQVGYKLANTSGKFRLKLPGAPDVDMSVQAPTLTADGSRVEYALSFGDSVRYARVALVAGNSVGGLAEKIAAGTLPSTLMQTEGTFSAAYTGDGQYTLVAVPFYNDHAHEALVYTHEQVFNSDWTSIGTAEYTEAILASCEMTSTFRIDPYTYSVQVERNKTNPNLIRIVDGYKTAYPGSYDTECDFSRRHFLEFDLSDRDCVLMHKSDGGLGYIIGTYGIIESWCRAERDMTLRGKTKEQVKSQGLGGKLSEDNVLTFPNETLLVRWPMVRPPAEDGTDWYWANLNGTFRLKLDPAVDFASVTDVAVDSPAGAPRYYNLQGVEVRGELTPGLYIKVTNGRSSRVIVK